MTIDNAWDDTCISITDWPKPVSSETTEEEEEAWKAKEKQDVIPEWWKGHKHARYRDRNGRDWIDEFAETSSVDEFRGAMKFTIGKYVRRVGKKDLIEKELDKVIDYCQRWKEYEGNKNDNT